RGLYRPADRDVQHGWAAQGGDRSDAAEARAPGQAGAAATQVRHARAQALRTLNGRREPAMPIARLWPSLLIVAAACAEPGALGPEPPEEAIPDPGVPLAATAATNVWATKAAMSTAREGLAVGVVNGIVYAIGGSGTAGNLTKVEAYTPSSNTWAAKASLPQGRSGL